MKITWHLLITLSVIMLIDVSVCAQNTKFDTTFVSYLPDLKLQFNRRHPYHQTLTMKLRMRENTFDGPFKMRSNDSMVINMNCEQVLEAVREIDNMTLGIPKVIYLVFWEKDNFPTTYDVHPIFKRAQDKDALESMNWLIRRAREYNTTISFHLNPFDAYEDGPLWNEYLAANIISRIETGGLRPGSWGYPISYTQEWKTGYTKKYIDKLCEMFPMHEIGTIHLDAFHSWAPIPVKKEDGTYDYDLRRDVISPFLGYTTEQETQTQLEIIRYWNSKGVDMTSEGAYHLRDIPFEGYQTMSWWFDGGLEGGYLRWPADIYCGGRDNSEWGRIFGTSIHGEDIYCQSPVNYSAFCRDFSINTAVWYFLNRLKREYVLQGDGYKAVQFSDGVLSQIDKGRYTLRQNGKLLVDAEDIFIPALWRKSKSIIAFSGNGYSNKIWNVPDGYPQNSRLETKTVDQNGTQHLKYTKAVNGKITLSVAPNQMLLLDFTE